MHPPRWLSSLSGCLYDGNQAPSFPGCKHLFPEQKLGPASPAVTRIHRTRPQTAQAPFVFVGSPYRPVNIASTKPALWRKVTSPVLIKTVIRVTTCLLKDVNIDHQRGSP